MFARQFFAQFSIVILLMLAACSPMPPIPTNTPVSTTPTRPTSAPSPTTVAPTTTPTPVVTTPSPTPTPAPPTATALPRTPTVVPTTRPATPLPTPIQPRDVYRTDPFRELAAYYDAINRKEYAKALAYRRWEHEPPASAAMLAEFTRGYSDTRSVEVVVNPVMFVGAATGNMYADMPTLLNATRKDGSAAGFLGCYRFHATNPGVYTPPRNDGWKIEIGDGQSVFQPTQNPVAEALDQGCDGQKVTQPFEDSDDPHSLIGAYYDAITRKDYRRAYGYWLTPPNRQTETQFTAGFRDTRSAFAVVRPVKDFQGAAGSVYASIPTMIVTTKTDGKFQNFAGCFVLRRINPQIGGAPREVAWRIASATLKATNAIVPFVALRNACG